MQIQVCSIEKGNTPENSLRSNTKTAFAALRDQIHIKNPAFILIFCSSQFDLELLGKKIGGEYGNCCIAGCTTAGEINSITGYKKESITMAVFADTCFEVYHRMIPDIASIGPNDAKKLAGDILQEMNKNGFDSDHMFGLLLVDGLALAEEHLAACLTSAFYPLHIIGGSAGDDLHFDSTYIYSEGKFVKNSATLSVIRTKLPFYIFQTQHFNPTEQKLVITAADPTTRTVMEINGLPAVDEYARLVGVSPDNLNSSLFSMHPIMLKINDRYYIRSIQKANKDKSLTFYCAIDEGLVLTLAKGRDIKENYRQTLTDIENNIDNPQFILFFDCILRRLEIEELGIQNEINKLIKHYNVAGFSTYGEQIDSLHVNQTLTGIALGESGIE